MGYTTPTSRSTPFCSYCGHPPKGPWLERSHRVCRRCKLGIVLQTPSDPTCLSDQPFLIVDRALTVQAVSRSAQAALRVSEPEAVGVPLDEFLISGDVGDPAADLSAMAALAIEQAQPSSRFDVRTVEDPELCFDARVNACGPPAAALLTLTVLNTDGPTGSPGVGEARDRGAGRQRARVGAATASADGARGERRPRRRWRSRA
jgi:hypothetical protein